MTWDWSKNNEKDLASYVTPDAANWLELPVDWYELVRLPNGRRQVAASIYQSLLDHDIRYTPEKYQPLDVIQPIRTPNEILQAPREGTCLDLSILFCGIARACELLPILVVLRGHALAAVSLNFGLREWKSLRRDELSLFVKDLLKDIGELRNLIEGGAYLAIECTGFARTNLQDDSKPELVGRDDRVLPFERAIAAGREQLYKEDRPLEYAMDIAVAHLRWLIPLKPLVGGVAASARLNYEKYRRRLVSAVQKEFPNRDVEFPLTFELGEEKELPIESLVGRIEQERRIILRGNAGGGKTVALGKCVDNLLDMGTVPVIINLKKWKPNKYSEELKRLVDMRADIDEQLDILLKASITDLTPKNIKDFPDEIRRFIFVDGLNEVYGKEEARRILDVLDEYVRENWETTYCFVTDRLGQRDLQDGNWKIARMNPMDPKSVREIVDAKFGEGHYDPLSEPNHELLSIPFFLDVALKSPTPDLGSAAKAIELYFLNEVRVTEESLNKIAEIAFAVYKNDKSRYFNTEDFKNEVGAEIWESLEESGAISISGDESGFTHQLLHDYLASRYMARKHEIWDWPSFDALTFKDNSFEPLFMVLEQLTDTAEADRFLKSVYDWNWGATVACLLDALKTGVRAYSREIDLVIKAVVAEKLVDPIKATRERATRQLSTFPDAEIGQFLCIDSIKSLINLVSQFESGEQWFLEWRNLFTRNEEPPLSEEEIRNILCEDPIMGWTASNVIRRFKLSDKYLMQLRAYYHSFEAVRKRKMPNNEALYSETMQWRVVHALGKSPTRENVELLFESLNEEEFRWVQYGSVRSLIEIAAIAEDNDLRQSVIERLKVIVSNLDFRVLEELGRATLYDGAPHSWADYILPLLQSIVESQAVTANRERAGDALSKFREFIERNGQDANG